MRNDPPLNTPAATHQGKLFERLERVNIPNTSPKPRLDALPPPPGKSSTLVAVPTTTIPAHTVYTRMPAARHPRDRRERRRQAANNTVRQRQAERRRQAANAERQAERRQAEINAARQRQRERREKEQKAAKVNFFALFTSCFWIIYSFFCFR